MRTVVHAVRVSVRGCLVERGKMAILLCWGEIHSKDAVV